MNWLPASWNHETSISLEKNQGEEETERARMHHKPFRVTIRIFVAHEVPDHANLISAQPILINSFHGVTAKKAFDLPDRVFLRNAKPPPINARRVGIRFAVFVFVAAHCCGGKGGYIQQACSRCKQGKRGTQSHNRAKNIEPKK